MGLSWGARVSRPARSPAGLERRDGVRAEGESGDEEARRVRQFEAGREREPHEG